MSCGITNGIAITCDDLRRVGGVNKDIYVANIDDIVSYTVDGDGYVTDIVFDTYGGLRKLSGKKNSHSSGYQLVKNQPGGSTLFQHDSTMKLFPDDPTEDDTIEDLAVGAFVFVVQDNNEQFFIYGQTNGMDQTEGVQNTGQESTSDVSYNLTFQGQEKEVPFRFLDTDFATSKAKLESYLV